MNHLEAPTRFLPAVGTLREPTVTVVIPTHNGEAGIAQTLDALADQTRRPDQVIVILDNCTDDTARVVARVAATSPLRIRSIPTVGNTAKKAGALNQVLSQVLGTLAPEDLLLAQDDDSALDCRWIDSAVEALADNTIGAVGGVFYGEPGGGLVGQFQRNEYQRYAREIRRRGDKAMVLTGTATMYRARVAHQVQQARGGQIPGIRGQIYDTAVLTEDNEFTLALKTLGYRTVSPKECRVTTEIMTGWSDLWLQRLRWSRGALENLRSYGCTKITLPYILQQAGLAIGIVAMSLYLFAFTVSLLIGMQFTFQPFWTGIGLIFVVERVVTVRKVGWKGTLLAFPLIIEMIYDLFQMAVYLVAAGEIVLHREARWHNGNPDIATATTS